MGLFSDLDLSGDAPLRARPVFGRGPRLVHSTSFKRMMRVVVPIVSVAVAVGLFFLGRMFYLMLTGQ
jgi:hypothetical protein